MPKDFFTEVIQRDPRLDLPQRVRDPALLEPITRRLVGQIIADARAMGIRAIAFETYRSAARQAQLFREGATQLRKVGVHHYGLACDIVKVVAGEPSWKGDYSFLGHLAYAHGLIWGGDWGRPDVSHDFLDVVHVQRCTVARQGALFRGEWYPDEQYNPYDDLRPAALATLAPRGVHPVQPVNR